MGQAAVALPELQVPRTHEEMFEAALRRPKNYFDLTLKQQLEVDQRLGILDWEGPRTEVEMQLMSNYHGVRIGR